jgi:hypothetical protein
MATALLALATVAAILALVVKDRERLRALMALDSERRAHELTRGERDGLRDAVDRMAHERQRLESELAELRALRQGGPFR